MTGGASWALAPCSGGMVVLVLFPSPSLLYLLSGSGSLAQNGSFLRVLRDPSFHQLVQNIPQRGSLFLDLISLRSLSPSSLPVAGPCLLSASVWKIPPFLWFCEAPREFLKRNFDQGANEKARISVLPISPPFLSPTTNCVS